MSHLEDKNFEFLDTLIEESCFVKNNSTSESKELNSTIKKFFKNIAKELYCYNKQQYEYIENKILSLTKQDIPIVYIALSNEKKGNYETFFPILNEGKKPFSPSGCLNNIFIDEDYDSLKDSIGDFTEEKKFIGIYKYNGIEKEFSYRLKFDDSYLIAQKLLFELSSVYKNDTPVLYNPFASKYFEIISLDDLPEKLKKEDINFEFEKNNLNVIENAQLYWNIEISGDKSKSLNFDKEVIYDNQKKFEYKIPKKHKDKEFVLPLSNEAIIYDYNFSDSYLNIVLNLDVSAFRKFRFHEVDKNTVEFKELYNANKIFSNDFVSPLKKVRLLTDSDIEYAIRPFKNFLNYSCEISFEEPEKKVLRYTNKLLKIYKNNYIHPLKTIYLVFKENTNSYKIKYVCDYINFVITYLRYFYPEIDWIGGM